MKLVTDASGYLVWVLSTDLRVRKVYTRALKNRGELAWFSGFEPIANVIKHKVLSGLRLPDLIFVHPSNKEGGPSTFQVRELAELVRRHAPKTGVVVQTKRPASFSRKLSDYPEVWVERPSLHSVHLAHRLGQWTKAAQSYPRATEQVATDELVSLYRTLAHEVGNLFQPLVSGFEVAQARTRKGEAPFEDDEMDALSRCVEHGASLVRDMLWMGSQSTPRVPNTTTNGESSFDVHALLSRVKRLLAPNARASQISFILVMDKPLHHSGDARLERDFFRAVLNLAKNAIEASSPGSSVKLSATSTPTGLSVSVEDQAGGVQAEVEGKLLRVPFTTKRGGNGIGLIECKRTIESHGGSLQFRRLEGGSRFEISLESKMSDQGGKAKAARLNRSSE